MTEKKPLNEGYQPQEKKGYQPDPSENVGAGYKPSDQGKPSNKPAEPQPPKKR